MNKKSISLSLFLPYCLLAQTPTALDEVKVETQSERKTSSLNIDLEKQEQHQSNSFYDLFKKESSAQVGGGADNAKRIYVRGVESSNLNITLDGAKLGKNIFQHRGNELDFNPDLLKAIDVSTAPDASNSSALGGAITMTTKDAQDFVKGDKTSGGSFKAGYGTNADTKTGNLTLYEVFNENFGAYASVSAVNNDNYKDGNDEQMYGTAYKDRDYLLKLSLLNYKDNDLRLTLSQNINSGNSQWGKEGTDTGLHNPNGANPLESIYSTTNSYALQHIYNPSDLVNLETNLNLSDLSVERKDSNNEYENQTIGLKIQNHFDFDVLNTKNRLSLGVQYEDQHGVGDFTPRDAKESDGINYLSQTKYADVDSNAKSIFIQNKMNLDALNIYYGARFDSYEFETGLGNATDSTISPNLGFDYALNDNSKIYANYTQNSRMTGLIPFTWMNHIKTNTTYSSDLDAETANKYEIGHKYSINNIFSNDDYLSFDASIFKTTIEDVILARDVNGGTGEGGRTLDDIYNSTDDFESKGFELKLTYNYDKYFTSLAYTQIDSSTGKDSIASSVTGMDESIAIRRLGAYDSKTLVFNSGVEITNAIYVDYTLNALAGIDDSIKRGGYTTHDVSGKIKPSLGSDWTYFLAVDNITDKYYGVHSTIASSSDDSVYRREMGRNFKVSVKYDF